MTTHIEGQEWLWGTPSPSPLNKTLVPSDDRRAGRYNKNHPNPPGPYFVDLTSHDFGNADIRLRVWETPTGTLCRIFRKEELPAGTPPVRIAIDNQLQRPTQQSSRKNPDWKVEEGETFQAWLGGGTWDKKDQNYGYATITWSPPGRKPR